MPAPFFVSIQTTDDALDIPLGYEPTDHDPIERVKTRRLSGLDHYSGKPGVVLIWDVMDFETWAHLQEVTGGRGVASQNGYLRFIDLEDTSGNEVWVDYACILDKPIGRLSQDFPGSVGRITMACRELTVLQPAS